MNQFSLEKCPEKTQLHDYLAEALSLADASAIDLETSRGAEHPITVLARKKFARLPEKHELFYATDF